MGFIKLPIYEVVQVTVEGVAAVEGEWYNHGGKWGLPKLGAPIGGEVSLIFEAEGVEVPKSGDAIAKGGDCWFNPADKLIYNADGGSYIKVGWSPRGALAGDTVILFRMQDNQ